MDKSYSNKEISYYIVSNRPFSDSVTKNMQKVVCKANVSKTFLTALESYTQLTGEQLIKFCKALKFIDNEGDYQYQRLLLQQKTAELTANPSFVSVISSIIELVQEKALPDNNGKIIPQDILLKFGVTSEYDLFPAPSKIEYVKEPIPRKEYSRVVKEVCSVQDPIIIHASGGIGKTVCATYVTRNLPDESVAILYDCFGGGSYRNRSTPRHKHHDALVQIINELALQDLCEPIIVDNNISAARLLRAFQQRVETVCYKLQQVNNDAKLVLIIDAADNAELAAQEFAEGCFVHELLMENYPQTFKLVLLCRTERLELVDPEKRACHIELTCFDIDESKQHLFSFYPDATNDDALEFHRLTCANPRVQINALSVGHKSIQALLSSLGSGPVTVDNQIQNQLLFALENVKRKESKIVQESINNICVGLATLPPFIPIGVLSKAASVPESMIKSLVTDIGRPLWLVDNYAVQFRDEPTETWFKNTYAATKEQIQAYITRLRPFAASNVYISEALPSLYLQADMYNDLVRLALSEEELPLSNPTIARNIRVYRLQFALKAALKLEQYSDTVKLALIAGEETAGKTRQMELLSQNIDLIKSLQSDDEIQTLAYRRTLKGNWDGSENLYSASLLSTDSRLTGEARNFLRAAFEWLKIYFRQTEQEEFHHNTLTDEEIGEFAHAMNNIRGTEAAVSFLCEYFVQSPQFTKIQGLFVKRLVDGGDSQTINNIMMLEIRNVFFLVALSHELIKVGKFQPANQLELGLLLLITPKNRPQKISYYNDAEYYLDGLISFLEACTKQGLSKRKILRALAIHFDSRASRNFTDNWYRRERATFLRVVALKSKLTNIQPAINDLVPLEWLDSKNKHDNKSKIDDFKVNYDSLYPWYQLRVNLLLGDINDFTRECDTIHTATSKIQRYRFQDYDPIPYETFHVKVSLLSLCGELTEDEIRSYFCNYLYDSNNTRIDDLLDLVRISYHIVACDPIAMQAELSARDRIADNRDVDVDTETKLNNLISLARVCFETSNMQ
jgi:hypothetical protein